MYTLSESREDTLCDIPYTILHHLTPSYTILHHLTPSYTILHHLIPSYTILHHLTPSYTILHHLTPPQAKDAKVSPTTSTDFNSLGRARPLPPCPSRLRCPAANFGARDSRFDSWPKPGATKDDTYSLKLGCQWTGKISQNHAKSAFVCFQ